MMLHACLCMVDTAGRHACIQLFKSVIQHCMLLIYQKKILSVLLFSLSLTVVVILYVRNAKDGMCCHIKVCFK